MSTNSSRRTSFYWLMLVGLLCAAAYLRGLGGDFLFDDFPNIVSNPAMLAVQKGTPNWLTVALLSGAGLLRRPLSMLSFGWNVYWFGMNPLSFKIVNLCIHLVNGALVYTLGRRLAQRLVSPGCATRFSPKSIAALAAGLWLLHPLHVSNVLYVVQRMNELATMFMLLGLLCYAEGRVRMARNERGLLVALSGLCVFGLLAVLCKENGALIAAYALVIEATCFHFEGEQRRQAQTIRVLFWLTVVLPAALITLYLIVNPHWLAYHYAGREFTLGERLLTEARVICDYLLWIFVPNPNWMAIFHDDIAASTGLLAPISTSIAIAFLAALTIAAWALRRRHPGITFAIAWFLVGHSMESTIIPLELVFEHRNYLPMVGLILGTACAVVPTIARWPERSVKIGAVGLLLSLTGLTAIRASSWSSAETLALADVRNHPESARAQYEAGRQIIAAGAARNEREKAEHQAMPYLERAAALNKGLVTAAVSIILIQGAQGTISENVVHDLADRLRNAKENVQANSFLDMLVAASLNKLSLTPKDVSLLVEAALANPLFRPQVRASIFNNYGAYQFNVAHDNQAAISLTMAAANEDQANPYFEINLVKIALALGQNEVALKHLNLAKQRNKAGLYDEDIDALQRQISPSVSP